MSRKKHTWQLLRRRHKESCESICVGCKLLRKQKNQEPISYGWQSTYSEGYQTYRHAPRCRQIFQKHDWRDYGEPWNICQDCGMHKLTATLDTVLGPKTFVYFRASEKESWSQQYTECPGRS